MNKIYSVLRVDNWNNVQEIYTGRIRDCKKSLETIGKEYEKRGWNAKSYDFSLIVRKAASKNMVFIYLIHYPDHEKQNNSRYRR